MVGGKSEWVEEAKDWVREGANKEANIERSMAAVTGSRELSGGAEDGTAFASALTLSSKEMLQHGGHF